MRHPSCYTEFNVKFSATVEKYDRIWSLVCTATQMWEDEPPLLLWCECSQTGYVPEGVWEAVEAELMTGGPARVAFDEALAKADLPFMAAAE